MAARHMLAIVIVAATAAFVTGVSIERSNGDTHQEETATPTDAGESEEAHAEESVERAASAEEESEDERVLGVDLEATPFVVLAAIGSLTFAAAAWLRPEVRRLLLVTALAMLAFAVLDLREVVHQVDESDTGLAVLAGVVAFLHLVAAAVAAGMSRRAPTLDEA